MLTRRGLGARLAALTLLSACGDRTRDAGFRDSAQPLTVTTRADFSALSGAWFVRAHFPDARDLAMVTFLTAENGGLAVEYGTDTCAANGACPSATRRAPLTRLGPRRVREVETGRELWLVWIDEGLRTAAIGTPDGSFAWILDRARGGGTDRINAAREVLDFNGYDVSQLSLRGIG